MVEISQVAGRAKKKKKNGQVAVEHKKGAST
jgi:hypothetical protein